MTDQDIQIIRRVAAVYGFTVHEEFDAGYGIKNPLTVTDKADKFRASFYFTADEGFDSFFEQVATFFEEKGYNKASRW